MPRITFLGHSCLLIETQSTRLIIDPFLSANPVAQVKPADVQVDYVLLTHGHADHWGDTETIAKAHDALVIASVELATLAASLGLKSHGMNIGGGFDFPFGRVRMTIAFHSTGAGDDGMTYTGDPGGWLLNLEGKTLYHAGDTALTYEMKQLGEFHKVDLAFLPIGDNFTMGVDDAVRAVSFIAPERVVPMHYNTFELIAADPEAFALKVRAKTQAEPVIMGVGDTLEL